MGGSKTATDESEWTTENLQKLLAALKSHIPKHDRMSTYPKTLKSVEWNEVAFPPFSPEECQEKWRHILQKTRKIRTLTEIIDEAEGVISSPVQNFKNHSELLKKPSPPKRSANATKQDKRRIEDEDGMPPKPPLTGYGLFCKEQCGSMEGVSKNGYVTVWAQRWRNLTEREKEEYSTRCKKLKTQYSVELNNYLMNFDEEKQKQILHANGIKRPPVAKNQARTRPLKLPGEPKLPSLSGFGNFFKYQMTLLKKKFPNSRERFGKINCSWHGLSEKEKARFKKETRKDVKKYSMELQKWYMTLPAAQQKMYRSCNPKKIQYLAKIQSEGPHSAAYIPSDSEDEDIEDSSSDEEEKNLDCYKVEEEEEGDDDSDVIMFEAY